MYYVVEIIFVNFVGIVSGGSTVHTHSFVTYVSYYIYLLLYNFI